MTSLFLLLGGNLGDRVQNLAHAEARLSAVFGQPAQKSHLYETAAWGVTNQPAFLNQVLRYETTLPPQEILSITQQVEQDLGRVRKERWGARLMDVDLLFYGNTVQDTPALTLPHPQLHLRRFTLVPLVEIAPAFVHPVLHQTLKQLLAACPDSLEVKRYPENAA